MIISLDECYFNCGAYGLIVFIENQTKAVKIFKKSHDYDHTLNVFNSETKAYVLAQTNQQVKSLVPDYFGKIKIDKILDKNRQDISDQFYLNMAYKMSYEEGPFLKLGTVSKSEYSYIEELFVALGINYIKDSSVTVDCSGSINKVIDFAIQEFEVWH